MRSFQRRSGRAKMIGRWKDKRRADLRLRMIITLRHSKSLSIKTISSLTSEHNVRLDLRCIDFSGESLNGINLVNAKLEGANLARCSLRNAKLTGADLRDTLLRNTDLRQADLRETNLSGAIMENTLLQGADLTGAFIPASTIAVGATDLQSNPTVYLKDSDIGLSSPRNREKKH